ncbi:hypothetical protein GF362_02290 [Candidatus Dojkabacteria bacterium]|nr:hypothetical protein [Candidatus Dojkabacteria bacterium]
MKFKFTNIGEDRKSKQKLIVVLLLCFLFLVIANSIVFVSNYSKYTRTEKTEASDIESKYWNHDLFDGRLEAVSCERIVGWIGTKDDLMAQMPVFFTIGGPYEGNGVVFNPNTIADIKREKAVCDFLDGTLSMAEECVTCEGTSCNHGFEINLPNYTDSPIFNNSSNNKVYAYGVYKGQIAAIMDGPSFSKFFLEIPENCGDGWDGNSDEIPTYTETPTPGPVEIPEGVNFDFNLDTLIDLNDFTLFANGYRECNKPDNPDSQNSPECEMYKSTDATFDFDFNDDQKVDLNDFVIFAQVYKVCNKPGDTAAQDSTDCNQYKGGDN